MKSSRFLVSMAIAAVLAWSAGAGAETLYAVSMRTYSDPSYKGVEGNLYEVSTETGTTRLITSLNLGGKTPVGLDGLAIHPKTGVFYGITAPSSSVIPRTLVTLDPLTGVVTPIGDLGVVSSDIEFGEDGTLYAWLPDTRQLGIVDLATGATTPLGKPSPKGAIKGGFTLVGRGKALVAAAGGAGTLDTVDIVTGEIVTGPALSGAPFAELINGLAMSPKRALYGINTGGAQPTPANLVKIDPVSGAVSNVGPLPNDTDALAFGPDLAHSNIASGMMEWRFPVLVALFLFALIVIVVAMRQKRA